MHLARCSVLMLVLVLVLVLRTCYRYPYVRTAPHCNYLVISSSLLLFVFPPMGRGQCRVHSLWVRLIKNAKLGVDKEVSRHLLALSCGKSTQQSGRSERVRGCFVRTGCLFSAGRGRGGLAVTSLSTHHAFRVFA